ncbi:hypothetical protein BC832DRAFT_568682 [Gaertneriomyces semiglobifer]|nr:hypothetical protein BC832DRAFT_568682 [Gaertneriomyces semiglobifer]
MHLITLRLKPQWTTTALFESQPGPQAPGGTFMQMHLAGRMNEQTLRERREYLDNRVGTRVRPKLWTVGLGGLVTFALVIAFVAIAITDFNAFGSACSSVSRSYIPSDDYPTSSTTSTRSMRSTTAELATATSSITVSTTTASTTTTAAPGVAGTPVANNSPPQPQRPQPQPSSSSNPFPITYDECGCPSRPDDDHCEAYRSTPYWGDCMTEAQRKWGRCRCPTRPRRVLHRRDDCYKPSTGSTMGKIAGCFAGIIISTVLSTLAYKSDLKASREETQAALAHLNNLDNARGVVWKYGELKKTNIRYEKHSGRVVSKDSYKFPVVFMETFDVPATFEGTSLDHDLPPTPVAQMTEYASSSNVHPEAVKVAVPSHPAHVEHGFASLGFSMPTVPSHSAHAEHGFASSAAGYSMATVPSHSAHAEHDFASSTAGYSMPYPPSQAYQAYSAPYTPTSPVQTYAPPVASPVESFAEPLGDQKPAPPPYSGP